jgi:hypothetical protein
MVSLQVTSLKVEVQGWEFGAGKQRILKRGGATKRWRKSQNPHPLINQTPKGCGTQDRLIALRMLHPPGLLFWMLMDFATGYRFFISGGTGIFKQVIYKLGYEPFLGDGL